MDSTTFEAYYGRCTCKFVDSAKFVSTQESLGVWPVKRKASRVLLLYIYILAQFEANLITLSDKDILNIVSRVNLLKYR